MADCLLMYALIGGVRLLINGRPRLNNCRLFSRGRRQVWLGLLFLVPAVFYGQDIAIRWTDPGWWFANSNDSFTQGLPVENDDLHTYGFAFGYNQPGQILAAYWDVYTWRGTEPDTATRTDRLLLLWSLSGTLQKQYFQLDLSGGPTMALQGNLGGNFVQKTFHELFGNFRPVPAALVYDPLRLHPGVQGSLQAGFGAGAWQLALCAESSLAVAIPTWQPNLNAGLGVRLVAGRGRQQLDTALLYRWQAGSEASPTRDISLAKAAGWQLRSALVSGPLFYAFTHKLDNEYADGIIGYRWGGVGEAGSSAKGTPADQQLWQSAELGLYVFRFRPEYHFHEQLYMRLHFTGGLPEQFNWIAELRNGGAYHSIVDDVEIRLWQGGGGLEFMQELFPDASGGLAAFLQPRFFAQLLLSAGFIERSDFNALRGTSTGKGFSSWLSLRAGTRLAMLELGLFGEINLYTGGLDVSSYALEPRWGILVGISSDE